MQLDEGRERAAPLVLGQGKVHLGWLVVVLEGDGVAGSRQGGSIEESIGNCGIVEEVEQQRPPLVDHPEAACQSHTLILIRWLRLTESTRISRRRLLVGCP